MRELYSYQDFNYITAEGVPSKEWVRVHNTRIQNLREQYVRHNCFTSIQMYKNDAHEEGETQLAPIYFDLDYKDDNTIAQLDAQRIVEYFSRMDIPQEHIRVYFSGSKGFHIVISPELFGIKPHAECTYIVKSACMYVASQLELRSFDMRVYSIRRMWRLPESVHSKTKLYCTEISHRELGLPMPEIREIAKGVLITGEDRYVCRAELWSEDVYQNLEENPVCQAWYVPFVREYESLKELANLRPKKPILTISGENPVCITDLLTNSIRKEGTRNQAEMALVSYHKDTGVTQDVSLAVVNEWATKIPKGLTSKTDKRQLEADVKGVVNTVYDSEHGDRYHFACHFIRALGTGTDKPIACAYDKCKFVNPDDQEPEKPIDLRLSEATRAAYIGKRINTEVMVAGRDDAPYGIPEHIEIKCKPDLKRENSVCKVCAISMMGGSFKFKFTAKDPNILNLLETSDTTQRGFIRKRIGIPDKCSRHRIDVLEWTNAIEIMAVPRIDFTPDSINQEEPYVVRKAYFIGHDIEPNKEYAISAYTYPDPKSQHLVHVVDKIMPLTDDIIQFAATPAILESLKKFQVAMPNSTNGHGATK